MLMKRREPTDMFRGKPCSTVAVGCATGRVEFPDGLKDDGYLSLANMDKFVRAHLSVRRKDYYKRNERPVLRDLVKGERAEWQRKAIVCCLGHYVYLDGMTYYSYFRNGDDPVVCVWWLKEENV